jgi:hypothetical protein
MPTTTAAISLTNDIASSSVSINASFDLLKAGAAEGMDAFQSKRLVTKSTDQVDLIAFGAALVGGVASTHNFIYIHNASTDPSEFITVTQTDSPAGSSTEVIVEQIGRLYGGDWMFIPWSAAAAANDIAIKPSVATEMPIEYLLFS